MTLKPLLFSFDGRINRQSFWYWNVAYYVIVPVFAFATQMIFPDGLSTLLPVFLLLLLWPDLAVTCKRWHDRNKSAYWLLLNVPLILGRVMTPIATTPGVIPEESAGGLPEMAGSMLALACGFWILIECGFLKGTEGPNRYGEEQGEIVWRWE